MGLAQPKTQSRVRSKRPRDLALVQRSSARARTETKAPLLSRSPASLCQLTHQGTDCVNLIALARSKSDLTGEADQREPAQGVRSRMLSTRLTTTGPFHSQSEPLSPCKVSLLTASSSAQHARGNGSDQAHLLRAGRVTKKTYRLVVELAFGTSARARIGSTVVRSSL
jgi:hypothetical protein